MIFPKGKGLDILSSNSVAVKKLPASQLVNPNNNRFLLTDTCPIMCFLIGLTYLPMAVIVPKGSYPNRQSIRQRVSSLEGDLVLTHIQIHQIT